MTEKKYGEPAVIGTEKTDALQGSGLPFRTSRPPANQSAKSDHTGNI